VVQSFGGGVPLVAAQDRAVAAVVHAYGRGLIDDAMCASLLDDIDAANEIGQVDEAVQRLNRQLFPERAGEYRGGHRSPTDESGPGRGTGPGPGAGFGRHAGPGRDAGPGDLAVEPVRPVASTLRSASRPAPVLRRLDAVDLALAARARGEETRRRDPRLVSLVVVVVVLVVLTVLGVVLLSAVRSHISGTSGLPAHFDTHFDAGTGAVQVAGGSSLPGSWRR